MHMHVGRTLTAAAAALVLALTVTGASATGAFRTIGWTSTYGECYPSPQWHLHVSTFNDDATIDLEYERNRNPSTGDYEYTGIAYTVATTVRAQQVRATLAGRLAGDPAPELGTVTAALRLSPATADREVERVRFTTGGAASTTAGTTRLTGTLRMPDGRVQQVSCILDRSTYRDRARYDNDAVAGALPLTTGAAVVASTMAADPVPEAGCGSGRRSALLGRTVWYRFTGTGSAMTLSTAGSTFDTVLGVYRTDAAHPAGCADAGPGGSAEAALRVPTVRGATYLVQVGGAGDDPPASGTLRLLLR